MALSAVLLVSLACGAGGRPGTGAEASAGGLPAPADRPRIPLDPRPARRRSTAARRTSGVGNPAAVPVVTTTERIEYRDREEAQRRRRAGPDGDRASGARGGAATSGHRAARHRRQQGWPALARRPGAAGSQRDHRGGIDAAITVSERRREGCDAYNAPSWPPGVQEHATRSIRTTTTRSGTSGAPSTTWQSRPDVDPGRLA